MKIKSIALILLFALCLCTATGCFGSGSTSNTTSSADEDLPGSVADIKTLSEYITLGQYKELEFNKADLTPTENDIASELASLLTVTTTLKEGTVENGDTVNIDYEGLLNGVAFEGGTASGYDLVIGSGSFIDGFESGLIGKSVGEKVALNLSFPDEYHAADLAGKAVVFNVTVNSIKRTKKYSETDSDINEATNGKYKTVEEYKAYIAEKLYKNNLTESAWEKALSNVAVIKFPTNLVEDYKKDMREYYETIANYYGLTFEQYLQYANNQTLAQFEEEANALAQDVFKRDLTVYAIAKAESIPTKPAETEYNEKVQQYAESYGLSVEDFEKEFDKATIEAAILFEKVKELVANKAKVNE